MMRNFDNALYMVLKSEGGYVKNPADPGGETNLGVTKGVWEEWVGHPVSHDDMKALTHYRVAPLYKSMYWDKVRGDDLHTPIDYLVFDFAVNAGVMQASKTLQYALGITADGVIGNETVEHANAMDVDTLIQKFTEEKKAFYRSLKTFSVFGTGWMNRIASVEQTAKQMVA